MEKKQYSYIIPLSDKLCGRVSVEAYSVEDAINKVLKNGPKVFNEQLRSYEQENNNESI